MERINDGLPETLEEVVSYYRGRYYKLKVAGDIKADLERLTRIASVLDHRLPDYRATLDGNEQYDDVEGIVELWRKVGGDAQRWRGWCKSTLFIEQPIKRAVALSRSVEPLAKLRPVIIDESDGELVVLPDGAGARLCRRLEQELQGLLQVDPQRLACRADSGRATSCRRRTSRPCPASACSRISPWCRCSA